MSVSFCLPHLDHGKSFVFKKSETKVITCGVPQCAVVRPLLFTMYINDLNNVSKYLLSILLADNTSVFIEDDTIKSAIKILN